MASEHFYREIKALELPITEVLQQHHFADVPQGWSVIIADVQNSTAAVAAGKHNDVNLVAAGSLIAALNIAKEKNIEIPFFFSGDGGAILVPDELEDAVLTALLLHNENAMKTVGLNMHIGSISIKDIQAVGSYVKIAKAQIGMSFYKALIIGDGLKFAEQKIKSLTRRVPAEQTPPQVLNMAGLECRWDKVKPPTEENEIVCYLVEASDMTKQAEVYRNVLLKIDELYGSVEDRSPLSPDRMKLLVNLDKIEKEMRMKFGGWKLTYYIRTFLENLLGFFFFKYNLKLGSMRGRDYLVQLIANADTLTIDGRINTIVSGKADKRKQLLEFLSRMEQDGQLVYGHHISKESIMTCYIENMNAKHIHFVDGSDGGYTEAAKELKRKLASVKLV